MQTDIHQWCHFVYSSCGISIDEVAISKAPTDWEVAQDLLLDDSTSAYLKSATRRMYSPAIEDQYPELSWSMLNHDVIFDDNFFDLDINAEKQSADYLSHVESSIDHELTLQSNIRRHFSNLGDV
tara:strand:+ start:239 stop:613 length:375 start_codon:yes stop_codon:yes gene_type:complete